MNNITIAGRVGKDAAVRSTQAGDRVAGFSVAVSEGKDRTTWFSCSLWGDRADKLAQYIRKGDPITVSGSVSARVHDGNAYLEVRVGQVTLQSSRQGGERRDDGNRDSGRQDSRQSSGSAPAGGYGGGLDDEIPFAPEWRG